MTRFTKASALLGALLVIGGGVAGSAAGHGVARTSFEAAAVATPTAADPTDIVRVRHTDAAMSRTVRVSAAADAALDCDSCVGQASSVQVIFAGGARKVVARNVAATWAGGCTDCRGRAVAVQLVVAASASAVRADNRAFAGTAGCTGCDVSAVALQFVVVDPRLDRISAATTEWISTVAGRLAGDRGPAPSGVGVRPGARSAAGTSSAEPAAQDSADSTGDRIADVLRTRLRVPVTVSVRVSGG
jgi:hypothetical protein